MTEEQLIEVLAEYTMEVKGARVLTSEERAACKAVAQRILGVRVSKPARREVFPLPDNDGPAIRLLAFDPGSDHCYDLQDSFYAAVSDECTVSLHFSSPLAGLYRIKVSGITDIEENVEELIVDIDEPYRHRVVTLGFKKACLYAVHLKRVDELPGKLFLVASDLFVDKEPELGWQEACL